MASILLGVEKTGDYISLGRFSGHFAFTDPDPDAIGTPILPIRSFEALNDRKIEVVNALQERLKERSRAGVNIDRLRGMNADSDLFRGFIQHVDYEFMAFALEGSIRMEGGELRIAFRGLGVIYAIVKALAIVGAVHSGTMAIGRLIDAAKYATPYIEAAIAEVMDLDILAFDWTPNPPEEVGRAFLHKLREERYVFTDLEALGIDLDAIARELAQELGETWETERSEETEPPIRS